MPEVSALWRNWVTRETCRRVLCTGLQRLQTIARACLRAEPSFHASETIDNILRMTSAKHTAEPGTPRTSAPVGASATAAAAAAATGTSPPGSVASSAMPPTSVLPSTPASGLTGGLSGLSGLTVFETALAGEEFYEREGYVPASPGRAVARTSSFPRTRGRSSSRQYSPTTTRSPSDAPYNTFAPNSGGTGRVADGADAAAVNVSPQKPRADATDTSAGHLHSPQATTYAQALMLPTSEEAAGSATALEAAAYIHAAHISTHAAAPPAVVDATPEESAALSRPDTESSGEEGGPEVVTPVDRDTDAGSVAPTVNPEMSFLSRAPEESDNLPPTHASFVLPSRFSRDLSRSSDSRLWARMAGAEEQVELSPDLTALQPPMAGGSLPRIGNRTGAALAVSGIGVDEETMDIARSQSTADQPFESGALAPEAQRPWVSAAEGGEVVTGKDAVHSASLVSREERHFSWCGLPSSSARTNVASVFSTIFSLWLYLHWKTLEFTRSGRGHPLCAHIAGAPLLCCEAAISIEGSSCGRTPADYNSHLRPMRTQAHAYAGAAS